MEKKSKNIFLEIFNVLKVPIIAVFLLWVLHGTTELLDVNRIQFGLYPRRISGLKGILTSPLFHSDWGHIFNNSFPLLVAGGIMYYFYRKVALPSIIIIYLLTGVSVWLFAHKGYHIGASGVAYGMVSFVFWSGLLRRNAESIILALITIILYSGMIVGIFPDEPGISWESHLFGGIMGLLTAIIFSGYDRPQIEESSDEEMTYFLPRDAFEKTIAERAREQNYES